MTRHTSNRHNKKNSLAVLLPAAQETTSGYQSQSYWMRVMVGLLSLGLLLQRFRGVMPVHAASPLSQEVTLSHDNVQRLCDIEFPGLAPLLLSSAVTYQTGNSVVGVLSSLPLWFARPVAAQTSGVTIVVPEFRLNSNVTGDQNAPAVSSLSTGEWVVVWVGDQTGDYDVYAQRLAANGSALGSEFRVNSATTGRQYAPKVASLSTGEWVVVWYGVQTGDADIYGQRYALNGSVLGSEFRVNSATAGHQYDPKVTSLSSGEWVVVWYGSQTGDLDIYAQRYALSGSMLGSEFRVNSAITGAQYSPAVASLSSGEWVVVWQGSQTGDYDIYAQRYAANGGVLGSEFRVNSATTGTQYARVVTGLSSGEWVVVWYGTQTGNAHIYAQRYALNSRMLGSEFRVNSNVTGQHQYPAVASLSSGEWVVVWQGDQTGDSDVYAQRYALSGSVLRSEFRVNSNVTGAQQSPAVSSLSSGQWVVVWLGNQTGNYDIYGSIFSSTGPLSTTASPTASSTTTSTLPTTVKSTVKTQVSTTLPSLLSTSMNDNSVKTPAVTTSLNTFMSESPGVSGTVTTATNQPSNRPITPQLVTATNANSGISGTVIGAAVGGSAFGIAACIAAVGFYAYRKKSRAALAYHSAVSEVSTSLKTIEQTSTKPASKCAKVNLKDANQSDNNLPVSHSRYGQIDEIKKQEKEYDHVPSF